MKKLLLSSHTVETVDMITITGIEITFLVTVLTSNSPNPLEIKRSYLCTTLN